MSNYKLDISEEELFVEFLKSINDYEYYNRLNAMEKIKYKNSMSRLSAYNAYRCQYYWRVFLLTLSVELLKPFIKVLDFVRNNIRKKGR